MPGWAFTEWWGLKRNPLWKRDLSTTHLPPPVSLTIQLFFWAIAELQSDSSKEMARHDFMFIYRRSQNDDRWLATGSLTVQSQGSLWRSADVAGAQRCLLLTVTSQLVCAVKLRTLNPNYTTHFQQFHDTDTYGAHTHWDNTLNTWGSASATL